MKIPKEFKRPTNQKINRIPVKLGRRGIKSEVLLSLRFLLKKLKHPIEDTEEFSCLKLMLLKEIEEKTLPFKQLPNKKTIRKIIGKFFDH